VLGTYFAVLAGLFVISTDRENGWRYGFLLGVLPALLILAVRMGMREPETWKAAREQAGAGAKKFGRFRDLFAEPGLRHRTLIATGLAIIGLATFWGAHFRGKDVLRNAYIEEEKALHGAVIDQPAVKRYEMLGMFLVTTGGGIGLLSFAPISQRIGRRPAFILFHVGGFLLTAVVFLLAGSMTALLLVLPVFGYFTLGMHAGYAVYFPELYPTRLRSTGSGFCFNMARVVVVPVLLLFAWLQDGLGLGLARAMLILSGLFLAGVVLALLAPETRGQPLPE
jgi:MFS family permease